MLEQPSILIREAHANDAPTIAQFNCDMAMETERLSLDKKTVDQGVLAVIEDPSHGFYLVAEEHNKVVGCLLVTYEWSDWRNGRMWWIQSVFVHHASRGRGVYKSLYQGVINRAEQIGGIRTVRLYVEKENHRAQSVYEKLGMHNSGYLVFETDLTQD